MPDHCLAALVAGVRRRHVTAAWALRTVVAFVVASSLVACGQPVTTPKPVYLRVSGSTTMAPLISQLAAGFTEQVPTFHLQVTGLGTHYGLEALRRGEAELAMVSWLPLPGGASPAVLEPTWPATAIARDGLAIIVHPSNPVDGLGLLQLQDVFSGRTYEWSEVGGLNALGPIQPVSREEGSGTRSAFESLVMDGKQVTRRAVVAASSEAVIDYVAANPEAIGYVSMGLASPVVKVLTLEGEAPTPRSVRLGSYPLSRELWLVTSERSANAAQPFVEFVLTPAGQQLVGERYASIR